MNLSSLDTVGDEMSVQKVDFSQHVNDEVYIRRSQVATFV